MTLQLQDVFATHWGLIDRYGLMSKDVAKNNFPKSNWLRYGAIVPTRQLVVKDDLHGFEEISRTLAESGVHFPVGSADRRHVG